MERIKIGMMINEKRQLQVLHKINFFFFSDLYTLENICNSHRKRLNMVFKRALDVSSNENAKTSKLDSKVFLRSNENKPELKDLTEKDLVIEQDQKIDNTSFLSENHIAIVAEILKSHQLPIHQAIDQLQSPETYLIIRHLLKSGISADLQNKNGETALHKAILNKVDCQTFVELLKHQSNVEIKDVNNESPLHLAFKHQNIEFVKELLKYGANPNHQMNDDYGNTLLHIASEDGNIALTKILLEHGANVNALDNDKITPLHRAIIENADGCNNQLINELLGFGANVNIKDFVNTTPLHNAAFNNFMTEDLFQHMLKQCNDLNVKNSEGETPLHIATWVGCQSNVRNLLRYGADANVRDSDGDSSLEIALKYKQRGTFKVLIYN